MKVDYLIVTYQEGGFCNSKSAFNNLLQADSQISINKNKLKFTQKSGVLELDYRLETDAIEDKQQRYFHIILETKDESQIESFANLLRTIRTIFGRFHSNISMNALWDDISRHYIIQAYPLINNVENTMRKLILKFMLVNVGMNWFDEAMPFDLKQKISDKEKRNTPSNLLQNPLHNADFIQLSDFLFKERSNKDINKLDNVLIKSQSDKSITLEQLRKDFLLVSNWDRYFSNLISYEGNLLKEKWEKLYGFRNKIAHNKDFSKSELNELKKLCDELIEKLNETIEKLDEIKLNEQQKRNLVQSTNNIINKEKLNLLTKSDIDNFALKAFNFIKDDVEHLIGKQFEELGFYMIDDTYIDNAVVEAVEITDSYPLFTSANYAIFRIEATVEFDIDVTFHQENSDDNYVETISQTNEIKCEVNISYEILKGADSATVDKISIEENDIEIEFDEK